jgi:hypothetical protein
MRTWIAIVLGAATPSAHAALRAALGNRVQVATRGVCIVAGVLRPDDRTFTTLIAVFP